VIACAVASAWRGAWQLLDLGLLPAMPVASATASLALGGSLLWIATLAQPCLFSIARRHPSRWCWIVDGLFSYCGGWCCVLVWRGAWHLWDHALGIQAPFSPAAQSAAQSAAELERGAWLCHGMGTLLLLLLDALRSLNTAPMFYASDSGPPLFGARKSPKWPDDLLRLDKLFKRPELECGLAAWNEWRSAVGLPPVCEEKLF